MMTTLRSLPFAAMVAASLVACDGSGDENLVVGQLASDRIELIADNNEPITALPVAEGATVQKDEVLAQQDASRANARLAVADAQVGQAQARVDELVRGARHDQIVAAQANVDGAIKDLDFRRSEYARIQKIFAQHLTSADVRDSAKAALDDAAAKLDQLRAQLQDLLAGTTVEVLAQAERALDQAKANRDLLAIDVARHEIRAPVAGIVDSRLYNVGERPGPGEPVLVLLAGRQPYARVYLPEKQRVHVHPGIAATVHVDGLDTPIDGRVRWVSSDPAFTPYLALTQRDRGRLSYVAKIDLLNVHKDGDADSSGRLPDGVPVQVDFPGLSADSSR